MVKPYYLGRQEARTAVYRHRGQRGVYEIGSQQSPAAGVGMKTTDCYWEACHRHIACAKAYMQDLESAVVEMEHKITIQKEQLVRLHALNKAQETELRAARQQVLV